MAKQYKLTKEKLEELQQELEYIKNVRENEVAEQIKVARGFGDLSENSEYDEAKNEQSANMMKQRTSRASCTPARLRSRQFWITTF